MTSKLTSYDKEIGILQTQMETVQSDITEIKKDIKTIIATLDGNFVTKDEFKSYKQSQVWQKMLIGVAFTLVGALVSFFFSNVGKR